jgi:hypothetical protein
VWKIKIHALLAAPFEAMHAEVRPQEPIPRRSIGIVRKGQHGDYAVDEEDELPAGT